MKKKFKHELDIQLFAEDSAPAETTETETNTEDQQQPDAVKTFTEAEVNKLIQGRLAKERKAWEQKIEEQQTEAQKLATMNETQRSKYEEQKRLSELEEREANIAKRELMSTAKETLLDKTLPTDLAEFLNYSNADSCNESINKLGKVFQQAVEKAVNERLKGGPVMKKAPETQGSSERDQLLKDSTDMTLSLAQRIAAKNKLMTLEEE